MAVVKCASGHFYNAEKFSSCPHCDTGSTYKKTNSFSEIELERNNQSVGFRAVTIDALKNYYPENNNKSEKTNKLEEQDDVETIGFYDELGFKNFVVGWLMCIEGEPKGKDFSLSFGRNELRNFADLRMVSPETAVVYDYMKNTFILTTTSGNVKLNNEILIGTSFLKERDILEIGELKLVFIPFCGGEVKW